MSTDSPDRSPPQEGGALSPRVSVVVPYYESGTDVERTLQSLCEQTLEDMEILVVDDGSVRTPFAQLGIAQDRTRPVRVERLERNRGYAAVTNHALGLVRGEWVIFVDADDTLRPDALERLLRTGEEEGADIVYCGIMAVRDGREIGTLSLPPSGPITPRDAARAAVRGELVGTQHALYRKPEPIAVEGYTFNDAVFNLDHLARAQRAAIIAEGLYRYTIAASSVTGSLRESVWELRRLPELARPALEKLFPEPREQRAVIEEFEQYVTTQLLHKAAREPLASPLRSEVHAWARSRIDLRGVIAHLRRRDIPTAGSWLLAMIAEAPHRAMYQRYDRWKDRRGARSAHGDAQR